MTWTQYIYGLSDERDGIIRYIGVTTNIKKRLITHRTSNKNLVVQEWINSLPTDPQVIILDVAQPHEDAYRLEKFHIKAHFNAGFPLLNKEYTNRPAHIRRKTPRLTELDRVAIRQFLQKYGHEPPEK